MRALPWLVCLPLLLLCACDSEPAQSPRRVALEGIFESVVKPMLADLSERTQALSERVITLCQSPDAEALQEARDAWHRHRRTLKQLEVLSFGPHTLTPWRLSGQLDFWPARAEDIEAVLQGDQALMGDAGLPLGASTKGSPALEYLLFGPDTAPEDFAAEGRRCEYLRAIAADLADKASALEHAWNDDFFDIMRVAPGSEEYASIGESLGEVVNNLVFTVEVVREEKLGRPFGQKNGGEPQPDKLESPYAPRSIDDAIDTLAGVEAIYYGRYGDRKSGGISALLRDQGEPKDVIFDHHMKTTLEALRAIDGPLEQALTDDRPGVQASLDALLDLIVFLQVDLAQSLAVTVTFGGSDGD
ncbi:MAG: imelysin family protein [Myxococcales bacterium]|nr:imelysin family protein [Myxococcales bacterium]